MFQQITLIGRLGQNPERKVVKGDRVVVNFSVAVNERWTDGDGQKQERVEWFDCEGWDALGETVAKFLSKGRLVHVVGRARTDKWEDENGQHRRTKIIAHRVDFLDAPEKAETTEAVAETQG
ncbi:MAG: single-stranded DNA-binding protein [Chloroflexi bacterium]|nr:single-stranded DNA-binding protein [Chloroflexota bacterium]